MFTKQHYEAIARVLQDAAHDPIMIHETDKATVTHLDLLASRFADLFATDSGLFKRDRFIRACVPGANVRART